jgi:hypothetical protein
VPPPQIQSTAELLVAVLEQAVQTDRHAGQILERGSPGVGTSGALA